MTNVDFFKLALYALYQERSYEFTQNSVDVLFQLKINTAIHGCLLCESFSLLFSVPLRDMKRGGAAEILYGVYPHK